MELSVQKNATINSLNNLYKDIYRLLKNKNINTKNQDCIYNLLKISMDAMYYQKKLFDNELYKEESQAIWTITKYLEKIKSQIQLKDNNNKYISVEDIYKHISVNLNKITRENFDETNEIDLVEKYSLLKSEEKPVTEENYHDVMFNENLQEEFENDINNIIFYGPKNSGKISQLTYNIDYYNNTHENSKIAYYLASDLAAEAEKPSVWGFESSAMQNMVKKVKTNGYSNNIQMKYYIILKNISYYKNYGNNSEKLVVSPLNFLSRLNKFEDVRLIFVENENGIEALRSVNGFKEYPYWRFMESNKAQDINSINKLSAYKIKKIANAKYLNVDVNNEVIEFIKEVNRSLYDYNDNIINLAYKAVLDKYFKLINENDTKINTTESIDIVVDKLIQILKNTNLQIKNSIELQKFIWFYSFAKNFCNIPNNEVYKEIKKFNNKIGNVYNEYKKFIAFNDDLNELNNSLYHIQDPIYFDPFTTVDNLLIDKNILKHNEVEGDYEITDYMSKYLDFLSTVFAIYNDQNLKLIDNYNNYEVVAPFNAGFNHVNLNIKDLTEENKDISNHSDNLYKQKQYILNKERKLTSMLQLANLDNLKISRRPLITKNYIIKISEFVPNNFGSDIFEFFIGINKNLLHESLKKHIFYCLFANSKQEKHLNIEITKEDFVNFIRKEFNNIVFPFESKFDTKDYKNILENIRGLNNYLKEEIIGQDDQIDEITRSLPNRYILNEYPIKPWKSYLFVGPTGVGKTRIAQLMGEKLFNNDNFLVINMSEYSNWINQLIDKTSSLTKHVSSKPQSIVLFDEIEKASDENLNILLQILSTGSFVNSNNQEISLKNSIVICTTNLNSTLFEYERLNNNKDLWLEAAKLKIREEILGRFDNIILFNGLNDQSFKKIFINKLNRAMNRIIKSFSDIKFELNISNNLENINKMKKSGFGARGIEAHINNEILSRISSLILNNKNKIKKISINIDKEIVVKGEYYE